MKTLHRYSEYKGNFHVLKVHMIRKTMNKLDNNLKIDLKLIPMDVTVSD